MGSISRAFCAAESSKSDIKARRARKESSSLPSRTKFKEVCSRFRGLHFMAEGVGLSRPCRALLFGFALGFSRFAHGSRTEVRTHLRRHFVAEGVGFEPTVTFLPRSISSRVPSTGLSHPSLFYLSGSADFCHLCETRPTARSLPAQKNGGNVRIDPVQKQATALCAFPTFRCRETPRRAVLQRRVCFCTCDFELPKLETWCPTPSPRSRRLRSPRASASGGHSPMAGTAAYWRLRIFSINGWQQQTMERLDESRRSRSPRRNA